MENANHCVEQALSAIAAKVAMVTDESQQIKEHLAHSQALLIGIQQELEELYVSQETPAKPLHQRRKNPSP